MTKLMLLVGLLASFALVDPMNVVERLGPNMSVVSWKMRSAFDVQRVFPQWEFFRRH